MVAVVVGMLDVSSSSDAFNVIIIQRPASVPPAVLRSSKSGGEFAPALSFSPVKDNLQCALGYLDQMGKCLCILHGNVGQNLAVQLYPGLL